MNRPLLSIFLSIFLLCVGLAATPWRYMPAVAGDGYGEIIDGGQFAAPDFLGWTLLSYRGEDSRSPTRRGNPHLP